MSWYSIYGTGATIHGIERTEDGRVEFTSWLSVLWLPVIPLRSWSAIYIGELPPNGITDESQCFTDLRRVPREWSQILQTFVLNLLFLTIAVAPSVTMIALTRGRAATHIEMVLVFAGVIWAVGLIICSERNRRKKLRGD